MPTPSPEYQLAVAIAAALSAAGYAATAARYRWHRPQDFTAVTITVTPTAASKEPLDRQGNADELTIDVAIQQTITSRTADELEAPAQIADEIARLWDEGGALRDFRPTIAGRYARWTAAERSPTIRPDLLARLNLFTAPIRLTYSLE